MFNIFRREGGGTLGEMCCNFPKRGGEFQWFLYTDDHMGVSDVVDNDNFGSEGGRKS